MHRDYKYVPPCLDFSQLSCGWNAGPHAYVVRTADRSFSLALTFLTALWLGSLAKLVNRGDPIFSEPDELRGHWILTVEVAAWARRLSSREVGWAVLGRTDLSLGSRVSTL